MRKFIMLIIALTMIAVMISGCGNEIQNEAVEQIETVTIPDGEPILREAPTEPEHQKLGVVNTDRLNVRKEPNVKSDALYQLAVGTRMEIFEIKILDGVPWGRIEDDLWVNLQYVDLEK